MLALPQVDAVIHLAGKPASFEDPAQVMSTNYDGTVNVVKTCQPHTHIVFISSELVFPSHPLKAYRETDATSPETTYGEAKRLAEEFLLSFHRSSTVLRTSMVYGYRHPTRQNFFSFLERRLSLGQTVELYTDVYRRPTHVRDLCSVIRAAIDAQVFGLYHATGADLVNRYELGHLVCEARGYDKSLLVPAQQPPNSRIPPYLDLCPSRMFANEISVSLSEGLRAADDIRILA
jgi:dTDP-4-dehydrorhamnose reductase